MNSLSYFIANNCRKLRNFSSRLQLKNKKITIFSQNCIGGVIYHDLGLEFLSPTVNLYMNATDFICFLENTKAYLDMELQFIDSSHTYPVALLGTLTLHFVHYHSKEEAKCKWASRCKRINWDNIFVIMTDRDGCTYDLLERFDRLAYKNKIVFTCKDYPNISSAFYINNCIDNQEVGNLIDFCNLTGKRFYDAFDYINWFNNNKYNSSLL